MAAGINSCIRGLAFALAIALPIYISIDIYKKIYLHKAMHPLFSPLPIGLMHVKVSYLLDTFTQPLPANHKHVEHIRQRGCQELAPTQALT